MSDQETRYNNAQAPWHRDSSPIVSQFVKRWGMLDGLRGVAILFVLFAHVGIMPGRAGTVGVTLFFVLSGFLITNLLIREEATTGTIDLPRFYIRRGFRLLPALGVYLAGSAVIAALMGLSSAWIWRETWPPLFYMSNYAASLGVDLQMHWHTWSLAVEEHFYLGWPVILLVIPRGRRIAMLSAAVLALAIWSFTAGHLIHGWPHGATDVNAYALGVGCLVALGRAKGVRPTFPQPVPQVGVMLLALATLIPFHQLQQALGVLISAVTIWACVELGSGPLANGTLRWFGRISYSLYLWHVPLLMLAGVSLPTRIGATIAATGVAWLSWVVVEKPMLRIRDRRHKSATPVQDIVRRSMVGHEELPEGAIASS